MSSASLRCGVIWQVEAKINREVFYESDPGILSRMLRVRARGVLPSTI